MSAGVDTIVTACSTDTRLHAAETFLEIVRRQIRLRANGWIRAHRGRSARRARTGGALERRERLLVGSTNTHRSAAPMPGARPTRRGFRSTARAPRASVPGRMLTRRPRGGWRDVELQACGELRPVQFRIIMSSRTRAGSGLIVDNFAKASFPFPAWVTAYPLDASTSAIRSRES